MIHLNISTVHCFNFNILKLINILLFDFCVLRIIQKQISLHKVINVFIFIHTSLIYLSKLRWMSWSKTKTFWLFPNEQLPHKHFLNWVIFPVMSLLIYVTSPYLQFCLPSVLVSVPSSPSLWGCSCLPGCQRQCSLPYPHLTWPFGMAQQFTILFWSTFFPWLPWPHTLLVFVRRSLATPF